MHFWCDSMISDQSLIEKYYFLAFSLFNMDITIQIVKLKF